MSQGNDIFDLLSGPPSSSTQQPLQSLHVNMAAPPPASSSSGAFSPNYNIDLSGLGDMQSSTANQTTSLGQQNVSSPFSPTSQNNGSIFGSGPQQQASFPTQQSFGVQNTQQSASLFGQNPSEQNSQQQSASLFGTMPGSQSNQQPTSLFGQTPNGQSSQQPSSMFGQASQRPVSFGQSTSPAFGQNAQQFSQFGQNAQVSSAFGQNTQPNVQLGQSAQSASMFGQSTQSNSPFGQSTQSSSPFGQATQSTSLFGQTPQATSPFGQATQSTSPFGQATQATSTFGQATQATSPFGQATQSNSPFGQATQATSPFGQATQSNSPFGQATQATSPFGQATQSNSLFGQAAQPTSPFGQATQSNSPFGQTTQSNSPFGQMAGGQGMQPSASQFNPFPTAPSNVAQTGMNNLQLGGAFPPMSGTLNTATPQTGADPFAIFSDTSRPGPSTATVNTTPQNEDLFAAFSSSAPPTKPAGVASIPKSASSPALDDSFFDAFSQSTSIASTPAPLSSSSSTNAVDSAFDPFGLMSSENTAQPQAPQPTQQQQTPVEPLFDAFSSEAVQEVSTQEKVQPSIHVDEEVEEEESDTAKEDADKSPPANEGNQAVDGNVAVKEEITDPVLKEINDKFGGRWRLARSDPYDEFLKSMGVGLVHRKRAGKGNPEQSFNVMPDGKIHVTIRSTLHSQSYVFKLNEETENMVEKVSQSVFCSYSNGKFFLQMTPSDDTFGKTQEVERFINDNKEMVQIHSAGVASCRRYFVKLDGGLVKTTTPQASDSSKAEEPATAKSTENQTTLAPQTNQQTNFDQGPPKSPKIQQKTALVVETPPSRRAKSPVAVVDLSQSVVALGGPSQSPQTSPPPTQSMTPGQLLLQNLQDETAPSSGDEVLFTQDVQSNDNDNKLIFTTNDGGVIDQESEA